MKMCSKCKVNERYGSLAYCQPCNAEYIREYREKKKAKMEEGVKVADASRVSTSAVVEKPTGKTYSGIFYPSYYVTPGTPLHKELLEKEKKMLVG